jgi:hypothetical protein
MSRDRFDFLDHEFHRWFNSKPIHAACQVTENPSESEEYSLRIPRAMIDKFGILNKLSPTIDSKRTTEDFDIQLAKVENGAVETPASSSPIFSVQFNQQVVAAKVEHEKEFGRPLASMSFALSIGVQNADTSSSRVPGILFDKKRSQLIVDNDEGQLAKKMVFTGVTRYTNQRLTSRNMHRPHILLDDKTGNAQLALPKVPQTLELSETEPTPLFKHSNSINRLEKNSEKEDKDNG